MACFTPAFPAAHAQFSALGLVQKGQAQAKLAIADQDTPNIHIYDARGGSNEPMDSIQPHRVPVLAMRFNSRHDTVISVDAKGKLGHCTAASRLY